MLRLQLVKVFLLVVLLVARTESKPAKGRKSAFGLGLLGGALAGVAVGHAVVKSSQGRTNSPAPAAVAPTRVVETGSLDARGCYKQTIKEPVQGNIGMYIETEHLICPNPQAPPAAPVQVVHQPSLAVPVKVVPVVVSNYTQADTFANSSNIPTNAIHIPDHTLIQVAATNPPPTLVYAAAPVAPVHQPALAGTEPRIILISQTVKKQKSAAPTLNISHWLLIMVIFYCLASRTYNKVA